MVLNSQGQAEIFSKCWSNIRTHAC